MADNKQDSKSAAQTFEDRLDITDPLKSKFFDKLRTDAYLNKNGQANYIEFWIAQKMNEAEDKWQVLHAMVYNIDREGGFINTDLMGENMTFKQAVGILSTNEFARIHLDSHSQSDMESDYPADKFPVLRTFFYNFEHYKVAANIEGLVFDQLNEPHRRKEGVIFTQGSYMIAEVNNSLFAAELAIAENSKFRDEMENGVLSDIYNRVAGPSASLDKLLQVGEILSVLDDYAAQVGGLYLSIQNILGVKDGFDKVGGLTSENERNTAFAFANKFKLDTKSCDDILTTSIPKMKEKLAEAKNLGIYTEPYEKFTVECEIYLNLLAANLDATVFENSTKSANNVNTDAITRIRSAVEKAEDMFYRLGGTPEKAHTLRAWVTEKKKDRIPSSLPGFITKYYETRSKLIKRVQEKQAGVQEAKTVSAEIKPPLSSGGPAQ